VCPLGPQFWSDPTVTVSMGAREQDPNADTDGSQE